jgi:hypothetical protein
MKKGINPYFDRLVEELSIGSKTCRVYSDMSKKEVCTNQATHTEGGHPVCDSHASPMRKISS